MADVTKKGYGDREKMMAEARSLHWTAQRLRDDMNQAGIKPSDGYVAPLGYLLSSVILQSLATETAIKATQVLKLGHFFYGHDLLELFEALPSDMRYSINNVYKPIVQHIQSQVTIKGPFEVVSEGPIEDVLAKHRRNFEDWRYLHELPDGSSVNLSDLRWATQAIILNFDVISVDASAPDANIRLANRMKGIVDHQ